MKLVYCPHCEDIFNLSMYTKKCACGAASGRYKDHDDVVVSEGATVLGFNNWSFKTALKNQCIYPEFVAFVIPKTNGAVTVNHITS